ncbi:LamG domain-containing protein [Lentimonas sp. CC4]|uniref:LamG domain-containing protein n=2 Tax=Lentimonas TaxID=417293 RepID=UPI001328F299|nr:LamG domain-containing protein [Lentimonas sp. CC4]CAA6683849.1 Unannotated [Lentimonas sp. CC6]CAA7169689.1 Unannotated [Lentimonas sp. CC21]CAA7179510.1 Unannotated [Lentimonas sp. CC8]CAA6676264.1 Unannotated [Lentimonas sp. CC4]CAA7077755.1 Unannotated [Lentimonas sp. CC4]
MDIPMSAFNSTLIYLTSLTSVVSLQAASNIFQNTSSDGLWQTASNWSLSTVPTSVDTAIVNSGRSVSITVAAPELDKLIVGNNAFTTTAVTIHADLTVADIRVAVASGSIGHIIQSDGVVTCTSGFALAATGSGAADGGYAISGGSLVFTGVDLQVGTLGAGSFVVDGSAATLISGGSLTLGSQGTLWFELDTLGATPLNLSGDFTVDAASQLVVDGSAYEGGDGYFPLVLVSGALGRVDLSNVTLSGFGSREPSLVEQEDGLWLRLLAPPSLSQELCSLVPDSTIAVDYTQSQFAVSRAYDPSGSIWTPIFSEAHVMDTLLKQDVLDAGSGAINRSWELRVARSGALYSFVTPALGEAMPPQWRAPNGEHGSSFAPWIDDLWQGVAVDTIAKNASDEKWFIHQAGTYMRDHSQTEPYYSPQVAAEVDLAERSFTTVNWGQQAHTDLFADELTSNDFQSHLLYYTRIRDLGQGLIEVSLGFYNFGDEYINHINVPWGGFRQTSLSDYFLSKPDGTWANASTGWDGDADLTKDFDETGGWMGFSDSADGSTAAIALVYGSDSSPLLEDQPSESYMWWKLTDASPEDDDPAGSRNYAVFATVRKYNIPQGNGVWGRYYFVMGDDVADVAERIEARGLLQGDTLFPFDYTEDSSPLVGYSFSGSGEDFRVEVATESPQFYLYAQPVAGGFPIFEIIENDYSRYLTWDPYATGVVKTYDGTIAGIRLLGFALRTEAINVGEFTYDYDDLATVLAGATGNYLPAGETLLVRAGVAASMPDAVAHWSLDNASGLVASDIEDGNYDGTVTGAVWDVGVERGALNFDGNANYVSVPTDAFVAISSQLSIALWAYGGSSQPAKDSVFYAADADGNRVLNIHLPWDSSVVYWDAGYSDGYDRINKSAAPDHYMGQWNHWVFTKNASTGEMKIYLNGALWHSGTGKTNIVSGITGAWIGCSDDPSTGSYDGLLDEVILYDAALSSAEVATLYSHYTLPKDYNAWVSEYPAMLDPTFAGDPEPDGIATGLEYVLGGSPTAQDELILPVLDASGEHFVFTFTRRADAVSFTTQIFQYGSTLTGWEDVRISSPAGAEVSFGPVESGLQSVTVTLRKALAIDGKFFGRLQVHSEGSF